jgi:hypothetical protein
MRRLFCSVAPQQTKILYDILGLRPGFTRLQLSQAWRDRCKSCHPDLASSANPMEIRALNRAYDILRKDAAGYANLGEHENEAFNVAWRTEFHLAREDLERCAEYIRQHEASRHPLNMLRAWMARNKQAALSVYVRSEEQRFKERHKEAQRTHVCFLLDTSRSMFVLDWDKIKEAGILLEQKSAETRQADGARFSFIHVPRAVSEAVDACRCISLAVKNIISILSHLETSAAHVSFLSFADRVKQGMQFEKPSVLRHFLHASKWEEGSQTCLYDALWEALDEVKRGGNVERTTFVVCTDGEDNCSRISLTELVRAIKDAQHVNLIIIALDVDSGAMQQLVAAAKHGKLLKVGSDPNIFGFRHMDDAFAKTKELLVLTQNSGPDPLQSIRLRFSF